MTLIQYKKGYFVFRFTGKVCEYAPLKPDNLKS